MQKKRGGGEKEGRGGCLTLFKGVINSLSAFVVNAHIDILARRCENLKTIFNGHYDIKPFNTFGATVRYMCNEGYILSGQPERVCQGDGYWSGKPPTCETEGKYSET